jgi:hypothetical protein
LALGASDVFHALRGRIPKVYLGDAAVEGAIAGGRAFRTN